MNNRPDPYHISISNFKYFTKKIRKLLNKYNIELSHRETLELTSEFMFGESYNNQSISKLRKNHEIRLLKIHDLFRHRNCVKNKKNIPLYENIFDTLRDMEMKNESLSNQFLVYYSYIHFLKNDQLHNHTFKNDNRSIYVRFNRRKDDRLVIDIGEIDCFEREKSIDGYSNCLRNIRNNIHPKLPNDVIEFIVTVCSLHEEVEVTFDQIENKVMIYLLHDIGAIVRDKTYSSMNPENHIFNYHYSRLI